MHFVRDFLRPGDRFIDVGANIGTYSLLAAATPEVEVFAFEPSSASFSRLSENIELNHLGHRVRLQHAAVGEEVGVIAVSTGLDVLNHVTPSADHRASEQVPMVSLDSCTPDSSRNMIHLIKIDVEGFEPQVLRGARDLLASSRPVLIVEANDPPALRAFLHPLGYEPFSYDPMGRRLMGSDWTTPTANNLLVLCDREMVEARLNVGDID